MFLENLITELNGPVCIMCGHFSIMPIGETIVPAIYQDITDVDKALAVRSNSYAGLVPVETFKVGANLASIPNSSIAILVNDWQHIPKNSSGAPGNPYREKFYKENQSLPISFQKIAENYNITEKNFVTPPKNYSFHGNKYFFSEMLLRNRFDTKNFEFAACDLKHGCAREYLPFMKLINDMGYKTLVSFIPEACQEPIRQSTNYARDEAGYDLDIINIFINGIHNTPQDFWENARVFKNDHSIKVSL